MRERIAFIHSYLSDKKRKDFAGNPIPDKSTRACTLAAAELYRRGYVDKIAFSVFPELANAIEVRSHTLLSKTLKKEDSISTQSSISTYQEIQAVNKLTERYNPEKIISICIKPHKKRVVGNYIDVFAKNYDKNRFVVKTFNEILSSSSGLMPQDIRYRYEGMIKESNM